MKLFTTLVAAVAAASLTATAGARTPASTTVTKHDQNVIRFFVRHPKQARTPAGERALWQILSHVADAVTRQEQSASLVRADWSVAVRYADRIWPGQGAWLWDCSGSEGSHGAWVWNGGHPASSSEHGSGAGGWMQFMSSTFYGYVDSAFAEARARGYPIPSAARDWYSTLGQAVTGAYMSYHGQRGQWMGAAC